MDSILFLSSLIALILYASIWAYYNEALIFMEIFIYCNFRKPLMLYGYWRHKPPPVPNKLGPSDITVIITAGWWTVSVEANRKDFLECLATFLVNNPKHIIIATDTVETAREALKLYGDIRIAFGIGLTTTATFLWTGYPDKRTQIADAIRKVETNLIVFADDHVFVGPNFLKSVAAVFENPHIGLCATKKSVYRETFRTGSYIQNFWLSIWNFFGVIYLERHNVEFRATTSMDGGIPVVSGRAMGGRADLFDSKFLELFTKQELPWNRAVRVTIGDDNFITRWARTHGRGIEFLCTEDATIKTRLGQPWRFSKQCVRWRRTTFQANTEDLLYGAVWKVWPWTTCMSLFPTLINLALVWDPLMVYAFTQSGIYSKLGLFLLLTWIYFAKGIKLLPYFLRHPWDFFIYFCPIPIYHLHAYLHSFISLYSWFTFSDQAWAGRDLKGSQARSIGGLQRRGGTPADRRGRRDGCFSYPSSSLAAPSNGVVRCRIETTQIPRDLASPPY